MHARKSRGEWSTIIKAYERIGGAHEEFCAARGLNLASFRGWLYRIRRVAAGSSAITLLPVDVMAAPPPPAPSVVLVAVGGVEVRVPLGTDVGYVAALVMELRARC